MADPPITGTQRTYLGAFDRWLRNPTPGAVAERQRTLGSVCAEATISPRRQPEQREDRPMSDQRPAPRTTRVVLSEALAELRDREARLAKLTVEIAEIRTAIKALEKLVPRSSAVALTAPRAASTAAPAVRRVQAVDAGETVLLAITDGQPISTGAIVRDTGLDLNVVRATIKRLREADKVSMIGDKASARYVLTADTSQSEAA